MALQFEVGIQTFNPEVSARISRKQDVGRLSDNILFLRTDTGVYVHADLIVGLPGEDIASFGAGFDRLVGLGPQEIQVGILKRLRGTPIVRHDREWGMIYSPNPPYEVLQTKSIDFKTMQRLRRFARYWDLVANSGNFFSTVSLIWDQNGPFSGFLAFSDWLYERVGVRQGIALHKLAELVFEYLVKERGLEAGLVAGKVWEDYQRGGRIDRPTFLLKHLPPQAMKIDRSPKSGTVPKRQMRRLGSAR
jgi:hypothetical protein